MPFHEQGDDAMGPTTEELVTLYAEPYANVDPRIIHVAVTRFRSDQFAVASFIEKIVNLAEKLPRSFPLGVLLDQLEQSEQLGHLEDWLQNMIATDVSNEATPNYGSRRDKGTPVRNGSDSAEVDRLRRENDELRARLASSESTINSLQEKLNSLRVVLRGTREHKAIVEEKHQLELNAVRGFAQICQNERDAMYVVVAETTRSADDLKQQMESNRLHFEEEKLQLEREMSVRNRQLQERVSAPLLKACMLDHIMEQGNVQLPNDCQISDINPCLTTGWAFTAFTNACVSEGYASIVDAIQKGGVTVGFHGTPQAENATVIFCDGFEPEKRVRQRYGPGEYFDQDMKTCFSYASGCLVIVALILKAAPWPGKEHPKPPKAWRIVANPPKSSELTYCFPVMALRQEKAGEPRKFTIPPCKKCNTGAEMPTTD